MAVPRSLISAVVRHFDTTPNTTTAILCAAVVKVRRQRPTDSNHRSHPVAFMKKISSPAIHFLEVVAAHARDEPRAHRRGEFVFDDVLNGRGHSWRL